MAEEPSRGGIQPGDPEDTGNRSPDPPARPAKKGAAPAGPEQPIPAVASDAGKAKPEAVPRKRPIVLLGVVACLAVAAVLWFVLRPGSNSEDTTAGNSSTTPERPGTGKVVRQGVDLMPLIDPQTAVNGRWVIKDGDLISDRTRDTSIQIPWKPPEEYDLHIEFTRLEGNDAIRQTFRFGDRTFHWLIAMADNTKYTFAPVAGKWDNKTTLTVNACLENGRRYTSVINVRADSVSAMLNGKPIRIFDKKDKQEYGYPVQPDTPAVFALSTWGSPTAFHSIRVVEVTGKGEAVNLTWSKSASVDDAFIGSVAAMSPNEQFKSVISTLKEFNPEYDGQSQATIHVGSLVGLNIGPGKVRNLSPIAAVPTLTDLVCADYYHRTNLLWDLSPLKCMGLVNADFANTNLNDLSPLKGMKLRNLGIRGTPVADLSPLAGMPLASFDCAATPVSDLTPLQGAPLRSLVCFSTRVRHLSPLRGMPIRRLDCSSTLIRDIEPLQGMPLAYLHFGGSPVRSLEPLRGMSLVDLAIQDTFVTDLSVLKDMPLTRLSCGKTGVNDISVLAGMPLTELDLQATQVKDLSPLKGMQLETLAISGTPVSDLAPLAGMPLQTLDMSNTQVADLLPLKNMPLTTLDLHGTRVTDLRPLKGMPLAVLNIRGIPFTDWSVLKDCPLQSIALDLKPERDADILKSIKTLKSINNVKVADVLEKIGK